MRLAEQFLAANGEAVIELLRRVGLSDDQANRFAPEAIDKLVKGLRGNNPRELVEADSDTQISSLLGWIEVGDMAARLGITGAVTRKGLSALIPRFLGFLDSRQASGSRPGAIEAGGGKPDARVEAARD
jgi:hypothetical protein